MTIYNNANQFAIATYLAKKMAFCYLNGGELVVKNITNATQRPICDQNLQGEFQDKQKMKNQETAKTGNLSENDVKEMAKSVMKTVNLDGKVLVYNQFFGFQNIHNEFLNILRGFKEQCGDKVKGRLLLPQSMQLLPLYVYAMQKLLFVCQQRQKNEGGQVTADMRIAQAMNVLQMHPQQVLQILYPQIYNLEQLKEFGNPAPLKCNSANVPSAHQNLYLFASPEQLIVRVGQNSDY